MSTELANRMRAGAAANALAEAVRLLAKLEESGGYFIRGIEDERDVARIAAENLRRGEQIKELEEEVRTLRKLYLSSIKESRGYQRALGLGVPSEATR